MTRQNFVVYECEIGCDWLWDNSRHYLEGDIKYPEHLMRLSTLMALALKELHTLDRQTFLPTALQVRPPAIRVSRAPSTASPLGWNSLPADVAAVDAVATFKRKLEDS